MNINKLLICLGSSLLFFFISSSLVYADSYKHKRDHRGDYHHDGHGRYKHKGDKKRYVIHHGHEDSFYPRHFRKYKDVTVIRHYGHHYRGYGHYRSDDDAYKWLAFTAITIKLLDNLNESQQREHEAAQVAATRARVGETVIWNDAGTSGAVRVIRDGTSTSGRYCREFQQEVTIGGRTESAYGTACRQADGSWEMISTGY